MSRLRAYVAGSAVLANVVLLRAYYERPNFYSAAVYISQSTGSLMFLINLALIVTAAAAYGLQRLFYGPLRAIETEQLYDRAWFAVSETLLAMTIFRDDIGFWFFAMFLCLLAGKVWQWIGEGRVEQLEQQPPANPRLFHARLMSSLLLSVAFDFGMMNYCFESILQQARPGVMVMFGFEYVLLAIASLSTLLRYALSLVELFIVHRQERAQAEERRLARERAAANAQTQPETVEAVPEQDEEDELEVEVPGWEEKGRWVFYLELLTDFFKSSVYLAFFVILMAFYGIPIHIMRDLFLTVRSFWKRIDDFLKYRKATRDMNERYPDATAEELARENTCIVCREEMRPWTPPGEGRPARRLDERQRPKKLPCGHILHFSCLRSWLERQQVCPTCRRPVLAEAGSPNGQQNNNAANNGQANPANPPELRGAVHQLLFGAPQQNQPQQQPGAPAPQGAPQQQNRPNGNFRVFNLGPIRIALGNIRLPPPGPQQGNNPGAQNNAILPNVAQPFGQNHAQTHTPPHPHGPQQASLNFQAPLSLAHVPHPMDVQTDILRIQQNIINSLRVLHAQNDQLEYLNSLLGQLNGLPGAESMTAPLGQGATGLPQHLTSDGAVLGPGDAGLPAGLVLPPGWNLRPLRRVEPIATAGAGDGSAAQPVTSTGPGPTVTSTAPASDNPPRAITPHLSPARPDGSPEPEASENAAGPRSVESSWSFGNVDTAGESSGSSSAVATTDPEAPAAMRRTVTVEDIEDAVE
ncbi:hypothetical protein M011DRAFT_519130 [Sporormia fimetaria CBS 119925]|uniref:RING-type E3 ubiquitin transferase n=1 Tax=Sporormia fimetaria CBS 119925 TaxID=1340428 RepID=A0A6A6VAB9_9PLEO|nr:hypothetical protein M011DRAFT_519130 [Sporormia fimetaria CBS 119925]